MKAALLSLEPPAALTPATAASPLRVSVVVPTYRRAAMLERCLAALLKQTLAPERYEIIVCDDGPEAATRVLVARLSMRHAARGPALLYLPVTGSQGPAGARNAGWRKARAGLVAFTDDDTVPAANWLEAGLQACESGGGAEAAAGRVEVPLPRGPGARPSDYQLDASGLEQAEFATANVFVKRRALAAIGGFDQRFTAAWREDSDLQFALLEAGYRIVAAPQAQVLHPVRPARWGVSLSQQKKSQFDALLRKKHAQLFGTRIRPGTPWLYYGVCVAALAAAWGFAAGRSPLAWCGLCAWLLLAGSFCARRLRHTSRSASHVVEMIWTSLWIPFLAVYWRLRGAIKFRVWFL